MPVRESSRHVEAVLKALEILDCFQGQAELGLKDLQGLTGLNKSRILRLCGTLEARGYLVHHLASGKWRLGSKLLSLGKAYERDNPLIALARPVLKALAQATGESATFYVLDGRQRLVLAREEGTQAVRYAVREGQRMDLHVGAAGKVLLAFGPPELRAQILAGAGADSSPELDLIRRRGWAVSLAERVPDAWGVAAPVLDHQGEVKAALGVAGPISRHSPERQEAIIQAICRAAAELSAALGFNQAQPGGIAHNQGEGGR